MTEPLDIDAIEQAQGRNTIGARERDAMIDALDLDAIEDSYLGYDPDYPVFRLIAAVRERDAEIARLSAPPGADVMERARLLYNSARFAVACDAKIVRAGIARALQQYGDERAAEIDRLHAAEQHQVETIARLSALRADAVEWSSRVWYTEIDGKPQSPGWTITTYARALQQYGDERAAAAIESLREPTVAMRIAGDHFEGDTVGTWRAMFNVALAAKPGSKT